jgi:hypothetical protein
VAPINMTDAEAPETEHPTNSSIRPVIEHALAVYYDGNTELAHTLIDRLLAEARAE